MRVKLEGVARNRALNIYFEGDTRGAVHHDPKVRSPTEPPSPRGALEGSRFPCLNNVKSVFVHVLERGSRLP